jgi:chemotaxis protein methyltransferase CheR/type IV pilus assembly protein PilK
MDDRQFADWARLLESRTGLFIAPERKSFLVSGLRARMRQLGCHDYGEYYDRLSSGPLQAKEWALLVDCLTVHETFFFRHASSMRLVEEVVLPSVSDQGRNLQAWSVGCATGEEAYSLAMLMDFYGKDGGHEKLFGITATDISLPSLHHARNGIYLNRRLRDIRQDFQQHYCRKISDNRFEVRPELRDRVCFSQLNVRDVQRAPFSNLDLIYCQNLLIYYDREQRLQMVNQLACFLRAGGVLILGPGEILDWRHPNMEKVRYPDTLAYRRTD